MTGWSISCYLDVAGWSTSCYLDVARWGTPCYLDMAGWSISCYVDVARLSTSCYLDVAGWDTSCYLARKGNPKEFVSIFPRIISCMFFKIMDTVKSNWEILHICGHIYPIYFFFACSLALRIQ